MNKKSLLPLSSENILQLLSKEFRLSFSQKGQDYFALCPFHAEKTPSFAFEPEKRIFKCFSCGFGTGSIFKLWSQVKKISLLQTKQEIEQLGYNVGFKEKLPLSEETDKESMFSLIVKVYQHNLFSKPGKEKLNYLQHKRQLNYATIEQFELSCSINHQQLVNLFLPNTEKIKELISINLLRTNERNQVYDFFSENQLIIPLQNKKGKVIAFAARKLEESEWLSNKYIYLPNTEKYQKSQIIYNYFAVKQMSETDFCYLVEGFFDVISLTQAGVNNCLAALGTSLSKSQISLLKELKKKIILFLDGDSAGKQAAIKITISLLAQNIECEIINHLLPWDPDEICRQKKDELNQVIQQKEDPYIFILHYFIQKWEVRENPQSINNFVHKIADLFCSFPSNIQEFLIDKISLLTHWNKEEVKKTYLSSLSKAKVSSNPIQEKWQKEKKLLAYCCQNRRYWLLTKQENYSFSQPENRYFYQCLHNFYTREPSLRVNFDKFHLVEEKLKLELQEIISENEAFGQEQ